MTVKELIDKLNKIQNKNEVQVEIFTNYELKHREIDFIYYDDKTNTVIIADDSEDDWELDELDIKL